MSYPAAKADPRVGASAVSVSFLTKRGGRGVETEVTAGADMFPLMLGFVRLARGEAGCEGGSWVGALVLVSVVGGGVASLVIVNSNCSIKRDLRRTDWL